MKNRSVKRQPGPGPVGVLRWASRPLLASALVLVLSITGALAAAGAVAAQDDSGRADGESNPTKWVTRTWTTLSMRDVPGREMLMDIARDYGMIQTMRALAREILAIDPKHREAHRHLNHTWHQGKWLEPEAAGAAGLLRFDYTFLPEYPKPEQDRLLFPLFLTKQEHKQHVRRQQWESPWVLNRKPLLLRSNCTRAKAERFAATFREFARHVTAFLGIALKSNYTINIYRSKEEYHTVGRAPRGTGGYYMPGKRELFFYDDPRDQISTYRVLFHEGTHMIVHLTAKNKAFHFPIAVNEGLAEYFAAARWDYYKERYSFGHPLNDRIKQFKRLLAADRAKPVKDLVLHPRRGFGSDEYAQAWALITYLCDEQTGNSPRRLGLYLRRIKDNKFKMLADGDPRKSDEMQRVFERTFFNAKNGKTWEEFQVHFWDYAANMQEEIGAPDFSRRYQQRAFGR